MWPVANEVVKITERAIKVDIPMGRDWWALTSPTSTFQSVLEKYNSTVSYSCDLLEEKLLKLDELFSATQTSAGIPRMMR